MNVGASTRIGTCLIVTALIAAQPARLAWGATAGARGPLIDRYSFQIGGIWQKADGEFSSTREGQTKIRIDLDDIGVNDNDFSPWISARLRLFDRWSVIVNHFGFRNDGSATSSFDFNYEDLVVPLGAFVDTDIRLDLVVVNAGYALLKRDRAEVRIGLGTHVARLDFKIDAVADVGGVLTPLGDEHTEFLAPLPNVYGGALVQVTDRLTFDVNAGWMSMKYNEYEGDLRFFRVGFDYRFLPRFGAATGFNLLSANVDRDTGSKEESYDVELPGVYLVLTMGL
jgi:hypothetical protein